jgi:hypothetical protein
MRIIGADGDGQYLCAIAPHELEKITGDERFGYRGIYRETARGLSAVRGMTIDVDLRYDRLRELEINRSRLDQAIGKLRGCADMLEPLGSVVTLPAPPAPADDVDSNSEGSS